MICIQWIAVEDSRDDDDDEECDKPKINKGIQYSVHNVHMERKIIFCQFEMIAAQLTTILSLGSWRRT